MKTRFERPRYQALLERYRDTESIKVLKGIRRCGKSTLLDLFADGLRAQGVPELNLFRKRFDEFGLPIDLNAEDLQQEISEALARADSAQTFYVFLDEVQMVPGWERIVRGLHTRPGVDVYITGSNAYLLSSDLATLLSGRYVELDVYPLSFREYRSFCEQSGRAALGKEELLSEYLRYGGMPSLFGLKGPLEEDIARELSGIYNTVILNDVAQRFQIRDYALLEKLVTYVFSTSGNLFSVKSIVNYLRSSGVKASYETIDSYLYALEQALILYGVTQDGLQGKELLRPQRKFYPVDTGLRNMAIGFAMRDVGFQLENAVFVELLRRGYRVSVGVVGTAEVDFVARRRDERLYVQVSDALAAETTLERELSALRAVHDAYPKYLITTDQLHIGTTEDGIRIVNVADWLLEA